MSMDIRYPNITDGSPEAQLRQFKSYLHQLVDQLNYALKNAETTQESIRKVVVESTGGSPEEKSISTFNSIKALIIKSADVVSSISDEVSKSLSGEYVAQSVFGTYTETTNNKITANSTNIDLAFSNQSAIESLVNEINSAVINVEAGVKVGIIGEADNGAPMYGIELKQRTEENGHEVYRKFARFTSEKLAFFDERDVEVAYISDSKLSILSVDVRNSFAMGGFVWTVQNDGSIIRKWRGI